MHGMNEELGRHRGVIINCEDFQLLNNVGKSSYIKLHAR